MIGPLGFGAYRVERVLGTAGGLARRRVQDRCMYAARMHGIRGV